VCCRGDVGGDGAAVDGGPRLRHHMSLRRRRNVCAFLRESVVALVALQGLAQAQAQLLKRKRILAHTRGSTQRRPCPRRKVQADSAVRSLLVVVVVLRCIVLGHMVGDKILGNCLTVADSRNDPAKLSETRIRRATDGVVAAHRDCLVAHRSILVQAAVAAANRRLKT
jgi:hypothetical protein